MAQGLKAVVAVLWRGRHGERTEHQICLIRICLSTCDYMRFVVPGGMSSRGLRALGGVRLQSTLRVVAPADDAPREVPVPLLFLSAKSWAGSTIEECASTDSLYGPMIPKFSKAGYTSLLLDVDAPNGKKVETLVDEMKRCLRSPPPSVGPSPFPPVLIARHALCILAEMYASSNPLSALQLVDPPVTPSRAPQRFPEAFPTEPDVELNFEAHFPVRVTWTEEELAWHAENGIAWYEAHRIEHAREDEAGECLDRYVWQSLDDGTQETLDWLENEVGL